MIQKGERLETIKYNFTLCIIWPYTQTVRHASNHPNDSQIHDFILIMVKQKAYLV